MPNSVRNKIAFDIQDIEFDNNAVTLLSGKEKSCLSIGACLKITDKILTAISEEVGKMKIIKGSDNDYRGGDIRQYNHQLITDIQELLKG